MIIVFDDCIERLKQYKWYYSNVEVKENTGEKLGGRKIFGGYKWAILFLYSKLKCMLNTPLNITVPLQDLMPISRFVLNTAIRDKKALVKVFKKYDAAYLADMELKYSAVDGLVNPVQLKSDISRLTKDIYKQKASLIPKLGLLEGYINRANGLTVEKNILILKVLGLQ